MKALILVGGYGTRLRPLTLTVPKPCVDFCNLPIVCHQIKSLAEGGVKEVILAVNYHSEQMERQLKKYEAEYGIKITYSLEDEPMGTAGPIRLAKDLILKDNEEGLFFVFNSDIICDFPIKEMVQFHKNHGGEGTLMVTEVTDPSKYGVIISDSHGKIESFVEKPEVFVSNKINAGLYLFSTKMIDRIPLRPCSIEREIFPAMAKDGVIYSRVLEGFWMDIGQPKDFIKGTELYLKFLEERKDDRLATGANIRDNVMIHPSAKVDPTAIIGPNVSIGENCVVGAGSRIKNSILFTGAKVASAAWISGSIIAWNSKVGSWCRVEPLTILAEDVVVSDECHLNGVMILPHKAITTSQVTFGAVIM
jgi:mannose-1-phosphate guanylyltransferase